MIRRSLVLILSCVASLTANPSQNIEVFIPYLPQAVIEDNETLSIVLEDLEQAARLHPRLIYHQIRLIQASAGANPDSQEQVTYLTNQLHRYRSVYAKDRWAWIIQRLQEVNRLVSNKAQHTFIEDLHHQHKAERPINFAAPDELSVEEKNRKHYYAMLYLSPKTSMTYDPQIDYSQKFELACAEKAETLKKDIETPDTLVLSSDWPWTVFEYWYLFDTDGESRYGEQEFKFNDLFMAYLGQIKGAEPVMTRVFGTLGLTPPEINFPENSPLLVLGATLPAVTVPVNVLFQEGQGRLDWESERTLFIASLAAADRFKVKVNQNFSSLVTLRLSFGYGSDPEVTETLIDTSVFASETKSFTRMDSWRGNSKISNFKTNVFSFTVDATLFSWKDRLYIGVGGGYARAVSRYDHARSLSYGFTNVYPNGTSMSSTFSDPSHRNTSVVSGTNYGVGYITLAFQVSEHLVLSGDLDTGGMQLRLGYIPF